MSGDEMKTRIATKVVLIFAVAALAACGDDGGSDGTSTPDMSPAMTPDMNPDANPDSTPDANPDSTPDANPDSNPDMMPDPIEVCEGVCDQILACADLVDNCDADALEDAAELCDTTCAANEAARDQIIGAGQLSCEETSAIAIMSLGLGDACGGDDPIVIPETYSFDNEEGDSTLSYSGQTARHVLISDLKAGVSVLSSLIDNDEFRPTDDGEVVGYFDFWFRHDSEADGDEGFILSTDPATLQTTYNEISSGKNIFGKIAGNDTTTDYKDWSTDFVGWSDQSLAQFGGDLGSPEQFVVAIFETIEENAINRADGLVREDNDGNQLPVYVLQNGVDLNQVLQKFLLGAVAFHQGCDDYLDYDNDNPIDGKGLFADNTTIVEGKTYTALAHAWDEGFGYFGAARNYGAYTDDEIAGKGGRPEFANGYNDANGDNSIDLKSEFNFGASVNAAKRDRAANAPTDFTNDAFTAFRTGRAIIQNAVGRDLTEDEMTALQAESDKARLAWDKAIAATAVHYINDTLQDMSAFDTDDYSFTNHAKHWSELKGFAMSLQFNPISPLNMHVGHVNDLIGDSPVLEGSDPAAIASYRESLIEARDMFKNMYGFDETNMGDANGENGW
jgi:hypothetical protein